MHFASMFEQRIAYSQIGYFEWTLIIAFSPAMNVSGTLESFIFN